jgi:hypothetical protein
MKDTSYIKGCVFNGVNGEFSGKHIPINHDLFVHLFGENYKDMLGALVTIINTFLGVMHVTFRQDSDKDPYVKDIKKLLSSPGYAHLGDGVRKNVISLIENTDVTSIPIIGYNDDGKPEYGRS